VPQDDSRPPWIGAVVDELAQEVMRSINSAAAVNPVNLVATALLATPRQALLASDLARQIDAYRRLLAAARYSPRVTLCDEDGESCIRYCESMKILERQPHALGDVVRMTERNAILQTYFRNNVLHLFAMPSLMACCFVNNPVMRTPDLHRLAWRIYPYISDELFLRWREDQVPEVVDEQLRIFVSLGLLTVSDDGSLWSRPPAATAEAVQLSLLAQATIQTVERYYLAICFLPAFSRREPVPIPHQVRDRLSLENTPMSCARAGGRVNPVGCVCGSENQRLSGPSRAAICSTSSTILRRILASVMRVNARVSARPSEVARKSET